MLGKDMNYLLVTAFGVIILSGCGVVENKIKESDDLYARPGATDSPLTGIYQTYQFHLLDRYVITHKWVNTSGCPYRAVEQPGDVPGKRSYFSLGKDIIEKNGQTWLRFSPEIGDFNFDDYVRSVKHISREKGKEGEEIEVGFRPICFESWWVSSHYLRVRLQKRSLKEMQTVFSERYPEGQWTSKTVNGRAWQIQETPKSRLRQRTGVGGPFLSGLLPLGDTGYTMALEMGASIESLQYPQYHAAVENAFWYLMDSVKIEALKP